MLQNNLLEYPGLFQYFYENHPDGICIVDIHGRFLNINHSALKMFGYSREELDEMSLDQLLDLPECCDSNELANTRWNTVIENKSGSLIHVRVTYMPLVSDVKEMARLIIFEDLTQNWKQNEKLTNEQEMFAFISEKSENVISAFSPDGIFTYISPTVKALLGYTPEEVIGKPADLFNHPEDNMKLLDARNSEFIDQNTVRFTGRVRHKNGDYRWYETTVEFVRNESGEILQSICVGRDITERKEAEETISHLAYHDSLTDLPNRRLFTKRVNHLLKVNKHDLHGLVLIDLDDFKYVNDTYGHEMGDLLLIEVAKRLANAVGDKGFAARWGGDEFTVIRMELVNRSDLTSLIDCINDKLSEPFILKGTDIFITASIGFSFSREDGDTIEALIKTADVTMYRAKGKVKVRFAENQRGTV